MSRLDVGRQASRRPVGLGRSPRSVPALPQLGSPLKLTDGQASADSVVVLVLDYSTSLAGGGP